jgi:hypothetical protein
LAQRVELHGEVTDIGLDFYHLRDYAQKTRRVVFGAPADAHDETPGMPRSTSPPTARQPTASSTTSPSAPLIHYPEFRANGWQIGSGPTEAECKTTTHRLKGRGRRWDSDNATALMALACLEDSHLWPSYWPTLDPERN